MKTNKYVQQARKNALLSMGVSDPTRQTKGKIGKSLTFVGRDLVVGAIGGALTGALIGRGALAAGAAVSGIGYYMGSPTATLFGAGMMASGGSITLSGTMNGIEREGMEGVKDRFNAYKENLKRQLFLDKIIKPKEGADESTSGLGDVQYFNHSDVAATNGLDFSEANRIEEQLEQSARQFSGLDDVTGLDGDYEDKIM